MASPALNSDGICSQSISSAPITARITASIAATRSHKEALTYPSGSRQVQKDVSEIKETSVLREREIIHNHPIARIRHGEEPDVGLAVRHVDV